MLTPSQVASNRTARLVKETSTPVYATLPEKCDKCSHHLVVTHGSAPYCPTCH